MGNTAGFLRNAHTLAGAGGLIPESGHFVIRPVEASDKPLLEAFFCTLSPASCYFRFGHCDVVLDQSDMDQFCHPEQFEQCHLVAFTHETDEHFLATQPIIGSARYTMAGNAGHCFEIVVAENHQGQGLGRTLLEALKADAYSRSLSGLSGKILGTNARMLTLAKQAGFQLQDLPSEPGVHSAHFSF